MPLLTGGAYAVSAALIIYADATGLTPEDLRLTMIVAWAVIGVALAVIAVLRRQKAE